MSGLGEERIVEFLRLAAPGLAGPLEIARGPADDACQRFAVAAGGARYILKVYTSTAVEAARREIAGLRLGGSMGLAPELMAADETGGALGGPALLVEDPGGQSLAGGPLGEADVQRWRLLLLTLHHLPPEAAPVASSMSPDLATWWQRTQAAWQACRAAYTQPSHAPLLDALTRLHVIVGVHVGAQAGLWAEVRRRPCHGNPAPAHVVRAGDRLLLVEWDGFGLGDPALEVGRVAALAALTGELGGAQYSAFIPQYLAGMADLRDVTLEERLRAVTSVVPLGFAFTVLALAAGQRGREREASLAQVARALRWTQELLGVRVGDPAQLLAPLCGR